MRTPYVFLPLVVLGSVVWACGSADDSGSPCGSTCGGALGSGGGNGSGATGGTGNGTGGTYVCPDLTLETAPSIDVQLDNTVAAGVTTEIHLNHLGYGTSQAKRAVIEATGGLSSFQIITSAGQVVVFEGQLEAMGGFSAWGSSNSHYVADFSALRTAGTYLLRVNGGNSEAFAVADKVQFESTVADVVGYFKSSRADDADVSAADQTVNKYGTADSHDVRGGWYDASGDISKYLSHLSYANHFNPQQIPLVAWSLAWAHDRAETQLGAKSLLDDVEAEALWGADYLVRVLDTEGYFYATVFDNWTGDLAQREICAFDGEAGNKSANYQAAFREGGGMAVAALARIASWEVPGSFTAAQYLAAAEKGFDHLVAHGPSYANDGQENIIDDYTALLAATELYAATQNESRLVAARARAASLSARLSAEGYFISNGAARPFWHGSDAGLPIVALARYLEVETDAAAKAAAAGTIQKHLEYLLEVTAEVPNPYGYARQHINASVGGALKTSFFLPHDNETGYWWQGESARLASLAAAAVIGGRAIAVEAGCTAQPSQELAAYATDQLDWILGKNPYDVSFLNGTGRNNPPAYCGEKWPAQGTQTGGISNGITGQNGDGSGIQWLSGAPVEECWRDWRWSEQWLPHSAWYLVAITALAAP